MSTVDWIVLACTLGFIVVYGAWRYRGAKSMEGYLKGGADVKWHTIGLSVMATQASAITFLSTPGLAFEDGMRFVQFYFGLPIAMIIIVAVFIPLYHRLNVYTAYEYLEHRFDVRVRVLGALLFLIQRGLAAGITIYAPAIVLSSILGVSLGLMNAIIGVAVIVYTVLGGTRAVSQTQKQQMIVIMTGMVVAAGILIAKLPPDVSLGDATRLAGALGRMNVIDTSIDPDNRYTLWSGLIGGLFVALSYFGTDQSQVQRYLTGGSVTASRLGLVFNGLLKIPMQFFILYIGVLLFVFYVFVQAPMFFNTPALDRAAGTDRGPEIAALQSRFDEAFTARKAAAERFLSIPEEDPAAKAALAEAHAEVITLRGEAKTLVKAALPQTEKKDADYVFIHFVLSTLPIGLIGLLVAVILSAAMSSTASELNALGTTTTIDLYRRLFRREASDEHYLLASKLFTVFWGLVALGFATFAALLDNLIEAVNILGSLFYGTVLGIFLVAFFLKRVTSSPTLYGAMVSQVLVITLYFTTELGYLWFNVIGCGGAVLLALMLSPLFRAKTPAASRSA